MSAEGAQGSIAAESCAADLEQQTKTNYEPGDRTDWPCGRICHLRTSQEVPRSMVLLMPRLHDRRRPPPTLPPQPSSFPALVQQP